MPAYFAVIEKSPFARERCERLVSHIGAVRPEYRLGFRNGGVTVLAKENDAEKVVKIYRLAEDQGVIIGRLFRRSGRAQAGHVPDDISDHESRQITNTAGRHLVDNYWGRYTAFLSNPVRQQKIVLSDPTGALPAYYFETDAYLLIFSNGADFHDLGLTSLTFNTGRVVSHIKLHLLDYENTGFNEIRKINRGGALVVGNGRATAEQYWHPARFVEKSRKWQKEEAARALQDSVTQAVEAWGSIFDRVGVSLSGGLDSSIVLAALMKAASPPPAYAMHAYFPASAESDERRWARAVAERAGVEIDCIELNIDDIDLTSVRNFTFNAEPINCLGSAISGARNRHFAEKFGVQSLLTGHGGDMVFLQGATASAEDYVWNHGWRWGALRCVAENALVNRTSFYDALAATVSSRRHGQGLSLNALMKNRTNAIIRKDVFEEVDLDKQCSHWLSELQEISVGKAAQLSNSWCTQYHTIPSNDDWEVLKIHPLLSQPVIETIARIPAYLFCLHGVDRGLARYAFRHDLPRAVAARQSKGSAHDYYENLYTRHLPFFRESLTSGNLVQLGILDAEALERALSIEISENSMAKYQVLELIDIEHWAKWWKAKIDNQTNITPI